MHDDITGWKDYVNKHYSLHVAVNMASCR